MDEIRTATADIEAITIGIILVLGLYSIALDLSGST